MSFSELLAPAMNSPLGAAGGAVLLVGLLIEALRWLLGLQPAPVPVPVPVRRDNPRSRRR